MPLESFRVEKEQVGREVVVVVDYVSENTLDYGPCLRDADKMLKKKKTTKVSHVN